MIANGQQRRLTNQEAVERRRETRALRQIWQKQREEKRRSREEREQVIAREMVQRFYRGRVIYRIILTYRYWQARKCGFDACDAELRGAYVGEDGRRHLFDPEDSRFWYWWAYQLHPEQRIRLVEMSNLRLVRAEKH